MDNLIRQVTGLRVLQSKALIRLSRALTLPWSPVDLKESAHAHPQVCLRTTACSARAQVRQSAVRGKDCSQAEGYAFATYAIILIINNELTSSTARVLNFFVMRILCPGELKEASWHERRLAEDD